jgi:hypothetical protein
MGRSWRLVVSRSNPCYRLIIADPKKAIDGLNFLGAAPPGHERARDRRIGEMDRDSIVQDTPHAGGADKLPAWAAPARGHGPIIRSRILTIPASD